MANNDRQENTNKISIATYGIGTRLEDDSNKLSDIVKQTALEVASKFGKRVDNKVIDNYTTMNLSALFDPEIRKTNGSKASTSKDPDILSSDQFKELMQDNANSAVNMLTAENGRVMNYSNYEAIAKNITECALALDTYVSNILSPDDYSKSIFNISYDSHNKSDTEKVAKQLKEITKKYKLEEKTEKIVEEALTYGDCFVSVLPYDKEIGKYLLQTSASGILNENASPIAAKLNESFKLAERTHTETLTEEIFTEEGFISEEESVALTEAFGTDYKSMFTKMVNDHIKIKSVTELLRDRAEADNDIIFSKSDIEIKDDDKKKKSKKTTEVVKINGSVIKILQPERMVALDIDDVCYGYYYIEPGAVISDSPYNANNAKMYAQTANPMNPSLQPQTTGNPGETASNPVAKNLNISDEKLNLISGVMLKALGKKLNKKYIDENKQFKDLLYNLLKQRYLFEKGISITYFLPEEIVHFKVNSIFEKIVFFAKIYLAVLTNNVIIKLGRGHDKRIFYVNAGVDNNHEQAIMKVIQDVKTKEFKMSNLGSISSILSLNPGAFDDLYMPQINGEKPVDIEVVQGMDQDLNNDFLDFLKKSMIQGTGLPPALMEATDNIEFARQISAQNANFCRRVVRYQKMLTPEFEQLVKLIYKYEYQYTLDSDDGTDDIDINDIEVSFPSPGSLNLSNMIEQFTQVDSLADYIMKRYIPDKADQSNIDEQYSFKGRIVEDKLPQVDWGHYKELYEKHKDEYAKEGLIKTATTPPEDPNMDPYGGGGSY